MQLQTTQTLNLILHDIASGFKDKGNKHNTLRVEQLITTMEITYKINKNNIGNLRQTNKGDIT